MKELARRRPSPALIISFIALAVAITGTASALEGANSVRSDDIARNAVKSPDIAPNAVNSSELAGNAVKSPEVALGAIGTSELANGAIGNEDLSAALANETLTSGSRVTMTLGEPSRVLLDNGTFRLVASCGENGFGLISIETTQPGSAFAAEHFSGAMGDHFKVSQSSFGPGTHPDPEERAIAGVLSAGGDINVSFFAAQAPNGAALSGIASASNIGAPCAFTAFGVS
jgi:hypothetical protein